MSTIKICGRKRARLIELSGKIFPATILYTGIIYLVACANITPAIACPKCGSTDTRFVESHYEVLVYECEACGCRFEAEEDQ